MNPITGSSAYQRAYLESLEARRLLSTSALFDLTIPQGGPFPSDRFTAPDSSQLTARRVNLPLPDITGRPSDYADLNVINTLDGFNPQPRMSIPFDGPIDVRTVSSHTVLLIKLADPTAPDEDGGHIVGINQTVWDVATNTLHVESDQLLEQHTRYVLVVTRGVHDADGQPVLASDEFDRFRHDLNFGQTNDPALKAYRKDLLDGLKAARSAGVAENDVTASVFTTMSVTATLEKMRDQIHMATPAPADFLLGSGGTRTVLDLSGVSSITFNRQTQVVGPLSPVSVPVSLLRAIPGAVGTVAFGKYVSPDYQVHAGEYIPPIATRTGAPVVQAMKEVYFNLFLPAGPAPVGGWPVAIFGHSSGPTANKNDDPLRVAASNASHGLATIGINIAGFGFGSLSTLTVNQAAAAPMSFLAGGRSIDQNGDNIIGNSEGQFAVAPRTIIGETDALRQTTADLMQLAPLQRLQDVDRFGAGYPPLGRRVRALHPILLVRWDEDEVDEVPARLVRFVWTGSPLKFAAGASGYSGCF